MTPRSESRARASITVTPEVLARLNTYQEQLLRARNRRANHAEIVGALLDGVPLWQADLMLGAYHAPADDSIQTD
jgi:hypothetical protein